MRFIVLLVLPLLVTTSPVLAQSAPSPFPSVQLPGNLARVLTDYEDAWQKKDAKALAALFAPNGFVLASGSPPARGPEAARMTYPRASGPARRRAAVAPAARLRGQREPRLHHRRLLRHEGRPRSGEVHARAHERREGTLA